MSPDPLPSVQALLPAEGATAAGVFAVQDQALAAGLLGDGWVAAAAAALVRPGPEMAPYLPWLPVSVLVAVSARSIHITDWHPQLGASRELARFDRTRTAITVEASGTARRLTLTETTSGYRLPLTATTSRFNAYSPGVRSVLADLAPTATRPATATTG